MFEWNQTIQFETENYLNQNQKQKKKKLYG